MGLNLCRSQIFNQGVKRIMGDSSEVLYIFVGPKKTGTTWLYELFDADHVDKEIRFPVYFLRAFVYKKYVTGKRFLVWPYLLHEWDCFLSLTSMLKKENREYEIVVTTRDESEWKKSIAKFRQKYKQDSNLKYTEIEYEKVTSNIKKLKNPRKLSIFNPTADDINWLSMLSGRSPSEIKGNLDKVVYPTIERSRYSLRWLVRLYFIMKPFLPRGLRGIIKNQSLRNALFRKTTADKVG